ncbi:MAG: SDR family oxidoreductase [Bdellovibrio sp.]
MNLQEIVLVNNAGVFESHSLLENDLKIWHRMFDTNLFAAVRLTQLILPFMISLKRGSIVNISSALGLNTIPNTGAYSASKAAMNMWSQSLALEMGKYGIRVNTICPGLVDTPIQDFHFQQGEQKTETLQKLAGLQPMGRIGTPQDVASAAYCLGSETSSWTTGSNLVVDGGINLV